HLTVNYFVNKLRYKGVNQYIESPRTPEGGLFRKSECILVVEGQNVFVWVFVKSFCVWVFVNKGVCSTYPAIA
ncbi:hypothetical protein HMPREF9073_03085, partial [Capnocytophaga sp. oral taxon 326 str. F0382]